MKGADHQYWEPLDFIDTMVEGVSRYAFCALLIACCELVEAYLHGICLQGLMDGGFNQHAIVPVPRRARAFRDCYELDIAILDSNTVADEECRPQDDLEVDGGIGMGHGEL